MGGALGGALATYARDLAKRRAATAAFLHSRIGSIPLSCERIRTRHLMRLLALHATHCSRHAPTLLPCTLCRRTCKGVSARRSLWGCLTVELPRMPAGGDCVAAKSCRWRSWYSKHKQWRVRRCGAALAGQQVGQLGECTRGHPPACPQLRCPCLKLAAFAMGMAALLHSRCAHIELMRIFE